MGQYYYLVNRTTGQRENVGKLGDSVQDHMERFGWAKTDWVEVFGDYGDNWHVNDPYAPPEEFMEHFDRGEWMIVIYAAHRMGVEPEVFARDFMHDGCPEEEEEEKEEGEGDFEVGLKPKAAL